MEKHFPAIAGSRQRRETQIFADCTQIFADIPTTICVHLRWICVYLRSINMPSLLRKSIINVCLAFALFLGVFYFCLSGEKLQAQEAAKQVYASSDARDPFLRQLPKKKPKEPEKPPEEVIPPNIVVQALVAGGPVPQAIIGGRIYRIGDEVQGAVVTNIIKEGVEVSYKQKQFVFPAPSRALLPPRRDKDAK